jgi:CRP/FNR family transcriptional regulator, cyclic AMP receptor protein
MARITILQNSRDAVDFKAGQVIFSQGDPAEHLYVIVDGAVEINVSGTVVGSAGPGEAFGEMALIANAPRSGTAIAKVDCRVVPVDKRRFLFMVTETPNFALQLLGIMAERLRAHNDRLVG